MQKCGRVFYQKPIKHLAGQGCRFCAIKERANSRKMTCDDFIRKAINIHGNKYDYSKVDYINNSTKVCIICPKHGEFWQTPNNHLNGQGCYFCGIEKVSKIYSKDTDWFINKSACIHNNKFDYSKVEYINNHTKVCIICPVHGEFWQSPNVHLNGHGCPKCNIERLILRNTKNTEYFIKKAIDIHGDKYDYNKVVYSGCKVKVEIICPIHGSFWQRPNLHLRGDGCPNCKSYKGENIIEEYLKEKK